MWSARFPKLITTQPLYALMSTDYDSLEESLVKVNVETVRVPPGEVDRAIDDFVLKPAVGVPLDREDASLPNSVTIDPPPRLWRTRLRA